MQVFVHSALIFWSIFTEFGIKLAFAGSIKILCTCAYMITRSEYGKCQKYRFLCILPLFLDQLLCFTTSVAHMVMVRKLGKKNLKEILVSFVHAMSCIVMSYYVMSCHFCRVMSHYVMSCHFPSCHVRSCYVTQCHVTSRHVTSCHNMPCHVTSRNVMLRHVLSHYVDNF